MRREIRSATLPGSLPPYSAGAQIPPVSTLKMALAKGLSAAKKMHEYFLLKVWTAMWWGRVVASGMNPEHAEVTES